MGARDAGVAPYLRLPAPLLPSFPLPPCSPAPLGRVGLMRQRLS